MTDRPPRIVDHFHGPPKTRFLPAAAGLHLAIFCLIFFFFFFFFSGRVLEGLSIFCQRVSKSQKFMPFDPLSSDPMITLQWYNDQCLVVKLGKVQLSHRSQKISPSEWPAAGILAPELVDIGVTSGFKKLVKSNLTANWWSHSPRWECYKFWAEMQNFGWSTRNTLSLSTSRLRKSRKLI